MFIFSENIKCSIMTFGTRGSVNFVETSSMYYDDHYVGSIGNFLLHLSRSSIDISSKVFPQDQDPQSGHDTLALVSHSVPVSLQNDVM